MTRKFEYLLGTIFITALLFILSPQKAHADDNPTIQVSPSDQIITDSSTVTLVTIQYKIDTATATLNDVGQSDGLSIISTIQSNVPNADTSTALSIATTQEPIATAVLDAGIKVQQAQEAIDSATVALQIAQDASNDLNIKNSIVDLTQNTLTIETDKLPDLQTNVDNTTVGFYTENANLGTATSNVQIAENAVSNAITDLTNNGTIQTTTNGVTATVYYGSGRTPALPSSNTTPIITTTVPNISFNWGSGSVMGGPSDRVIVKFEGTITVPEEAVAVKYAVSSDDGSIMYIDGQLAINNWRDQGTAWSPYSPVYNTTTDKQQDFVIWYYENGGGATCTLGWLIWRADGSGYFTTPGPTAFGTTTTIQDPVKVAAVDTAKANLGSANSAYSTQLAIRDAAYQAWQDAIHAVDAQQSVIDSAQTAYDTAQTDLVNAQNLAQITLQTANSFADTATVTVQSAVTAMNDAVQVTNDYYAEQQRFANEARIAAQQAANAKAAAEAKAAEDAHIATEKAAKEAEAAKAKAEEDARIAAEKAAQAAADAAKAEADAKAKAAADAALAEQKAKDEAAKAAQETANAKAEADKKAAEDLRIAAEKAAKEQAAKDAQAKADAAKAEQDAKDKAKQDAIGVIPNSPDQLSDTVVKEAPVEVLVPHIQEDKAGVENGGIEFFGTKSAPQIVGEDGKLTPPAPPPGSGLPIPEDAITTQDTFIGQPGGTTFNAPDIAVPVIETPVEGALAVVPGIQSLNHAFVAMSNIGNDMSPVTRKKAKKILVLTIAVGAVARRRFGQ